MIRPLVLALTLIALAPRACVAVEYREHLRADEIALLHAAREYVHGPVATVELTPQDSLLPAVHEPRSGTAFTDSCYAYFLEGGEYRQRFAVYVPVRSLLPFAQKAARMLSIIAGMAERRFGKLCARLNGPPVRVWMTQTGESGGEQEGANLYIYNVLAPRSPIEWARELAHEYGHFLLPSASGYKEPESWANGVLGERLFLKWLAEDIQAGRTDPEEVPFIRPMDLTDYCAKQVEPLVQRMRESGPELSTLAKLDHLGMNAFTGILLYMDSTYGSASLMRMLVGLPQDQSKPYRGTDFLHALAVWLGSEKRTETTLPPDGGMLYLPAGKYRVSAKSGSLRRLTVSGAPVHGEGIDWSVAPASDGWYQVAAASPALVWDRVR